MMSWPEAFVVVGVLISAALVFGFVKGSLKFEVNVVKANGDSEVQNEHD